MGKKLIKKNELSLEFEDDMELMKKQISELEKIKKTILDSSEYKLLDGKTQMIGTYKEEEYPNGAHSRGEHTECVANIAKDIITKIYEKFGSEEEQQTEVYQLNKKIAELYAEIMGYSHDLGHTPFGHVGESGLDEFMKSVTDPEEKRQILEHRRMMFGAEYEAAQGHKNVSYRGKLSFEHNEQSAKVFYDIVRRGNINQDLVDVKRVILGILCHSTSRVDITEIPDDIVVQSIRAADKIEYINKDYEELELCLNKPKNKKIAEFTKFPYHERVKRVIDNVVEESFEYGRIDEDMDALQILNDLKKISDACVRLVDEDGKRGLVKDENVERLKLVALKVAQYYYEHNDIVMYNDVSWEMHPIDYRKLTSRLYAYQTLGAYPENRVEKVIKYVSSMDNTRCEQVYEKLVRERILRGKGYGIEPITIDEIEEKKAKQLKDAVKGLTSEKYRLTFDERAESAREMNEKYISNELNDHGRDEMKKNRKKHEKQNERDFYAYRLMKFADSMRDMGKSQSEIEEAVLKEFKENWKEEKYEITPYDGKIAKYSRGEFEK